MKNWALKETLLVVLALILIVVFLIPKYVLTTKRVIAQEAIRTVYLMNDVVTEHRIPNGNFTADLQELNLERINEIEKAKFTYRISRFFANEYEIIASGKKGSAAEGIVVGYNLAQKRYYIEYLGRTIGGKKYNTEEEVLQ